jgi:hypothetical protein
VTPVLRLYVRFHFYKKKGVVDLEARLFHNRISNVDHGNVSKADRPSHLPGLEYEKYLSNSSDYFSAAVKHLTGQQC